MEMNWEWVAGAVVAVGALGTAAFGLVEAFGKALVLGRVGLPFVGYGCVRVVIKLYAPALKFTYGDAYERILIQEYRDGRGKGRAPETIRQGVRLALPLMEAAEARAIVQGAWGMEAQAAEDLVDALQAEARTGKALTAKAAKDAALLAGRFGLALDSRIAAAFTLAEEKYQAAARLWAGIAAIVLALAFNWSLSTTASGGYPYWIAVLIGAAAVPLAPVAKDISSALTDALKAWRQVGSPGKA